VDSIKRRRNIAIAASAALLVVVALTSALWLGVKAATISSELTAAQAVIPDVRSHILGGDSAAARIDVNELKSHTANAREAATHPLWRMAGALPGVGANFQAVAEIAVSADDIARLGAAPLVDVFGAIDWKTLMPKGQGLQLEPLAAAQSKLASAAHALRQSSERLDAIAVDRLMPQIAEPLSRVREELAPLREGLDSAADAAQILPSMMGNDSPRSYLLLIQNNAELRATGGIPGALAVLNVDKGKLSLGGQSSASALGPFNPRVNVDPEQQQIYSPRLGKFMQDVNLTPDFPTAAQTAQAMWSERTGQELDGVLAIDPVALSYIIDATGHVKIDDPPLREVAADRLPMELTAKNVVPTLLSNVYSEIPDPTMQDVYFAGVAKAVFTKISAGTGDTRKLIDGLTKGTSEGRILLWSRSSEEQSVIAKNPISGSISGSSISPAQFGVYFNDGTGAKMDYYIKRTVQLIEECPNSGYGQVKVRVTSTNSAPKDAATSLPDYVTGGAAFGVPEGTVQTNIVAYGPVQANVESVMADGKKISFASQLHGERPVGTVTVALPPGKSSTVEFLFDKIVQHSQPQLSVTPTVQPLKDVVLGTNTKTCVAAP
jgi:Protein of unknown function (DUF4012)